MFWSASTVTEHRSQWFRFNISTKRCNWVPVIDHASPSMFHPNQRRLFWSSNRSVSMLFGLLDLTRDRSVLWGVSLCSHALKHGFTKRSASVWNLIENISRCFLTVQKLASYLVEELNVIFDACLYAVFTANKIFLLGFKEVHINFNYGRFWWSAMKLRIPIDTFSCYIWLIYKLV